MYKLVLLTVAGVLTSWKVAGEKMWLNEVYYAPSNSDTAAIEIVLRPNQDDLENDSEQTHVEVTWYGEGEIAESMKQVNVKRNSGSAHELWKDNWFGDHSQNHLASAFKADAAGGIKLYSQLSKESRVYCWGEGAAVGTALVDDEDDTKCDVLVSQEMDAAETNYAMIDNSSTPENGGTQESHFSFTKFNDEADKVMNSIGQPNNCPSGSDCKDEIKQTMGEYSMAWSVRSFAVIVSAVVATLLSIGVA